MGCVFALCECTHCVYDSVEIIQTIWQLNRTSVKNYLQIYKTPNAKIVLLSVIMTISLLLLLLLFTSRFVLKCLGPLDGFSIDQK